MRKNDDVMVSIVLVSYKQLKYIKDAIDSILMQKVNFKYELILADDCSQDGTLEVMREYEKKYPNIVKVLERKHNLGAANNSMDAFSYATGKYVATLEGDDYWCDENKLQSQVDFLEEHPDFYSVSHLQEGRNLDNKLIGYFPKGISKDIVIENVDDFIKNNRVFSASTAMFRNFFLDDKLLKRYNDLRKLDSLIGDAQFNIMICSLGKHYIFAKPMMVYRMRHNDGDSNFNSAHRVNEIQYRYMSIYIGIEKIYNYKYSLYRKIKANYALGVSYDICRFDFADIRKFNKLCPKKYKWKIALLFPFTALRIVFNRFIRK